MEKYYLGQFEEDLIKINGLLVKGIYSSYQDHFDAFNIFADAMKNLGDNIELLGCDDYYLLHNTVLMYTAVRKLFSSYSALVPMQTEINRSFVAIINHPKVKELQLDRKYNGEVNLWKI